jgi:hypothetical protein
LKWNWHDASGAINKPAVANVIRNILMHDTSIVPDNAALAKLRGVNEKVFGLADGRPIMDCDD